MGAEPEPYFLLPHSALSTPRGRQERLVCDWWALPSFVFDTQRSAIHLPCHWQTRQAGKGDAWSSLPTPSRDGMLIKSQI
ncbi:hypothetical protein EYF80_004928 [Liparis tanakae]|uniref:Uncharacterized protein n=1 Tax=Liparis tanakae TaxID=230148 RepID=A0A4Z2J5S7_9TELE|nr:hypothetical protein EYF80_004928 [Liparis tanakae]